MTLHNLSVRVGVVALGLALVCFVGCAKKQSPPPRSARAAAQPVAQPTDRECREFADAFEAALRSENPLNVNELIDWDEILDRAMEGVEAPDQLRRNFKTGFERALSLPDALAPQLIEVIRKGGQYRFLRSHSSGEEKRVMFRLLANNLGGVNYHDFILVRKRDGKVVACDMYVFATGELLSQTARWSFLPAAADASKSVLARLTQPENEYLANLSKIQGMTSDLRTGRMQEVLDAYSRLPTSLRKAKLIQLIRLQAAAAKSDAEYREAISSIRQLFPGDPCLHLIMIDHYMLRKQYGQVRASIDRVDKSVGGDPYLDVLRANLFVAEKDYRRAQEHARKALQAEETLVTAYWPLLAVSLEEKDHDETTRLLTIMGDKFGVAFNDLTTTPEYAEFVKSPQYKTWLEKTKRK